MTDPAPIPPPPPALEDPPAWKIWISAGIAIIALLGFIYVFYLAFTQNSDKTAPQKNARTAETPTPPPNDASKRTQVATMLAGLVTSVVAAALGVSTGTSTGKTTRFARIRAAVARVGETVSRWSTADIRRYLAIAYAFTYVLVGAAAVIVWLATKSPPEEVKNLAWTFLGFVFAVVKSTF